jgi:hypothetical protein
MINRKFATDQIARLGAIPAAGFMTALGLRELVRVALDCADSEDTLERAITHWLREESKTPAPVDLIQVIAAVRGDRAAAFRPPVACCRSCLGTGYELVTDAKGRSCARRCACTRAPIQVPLSQNAGVRV